MFLSKKGVSPLIATVLLISFAVALGAVVMNWAHSFSESSTCGQVDLRISNLGGETQLCFDATTQQIRGEILASTQLNGLNVIARGQNGESESRVVKEVAASTASSFVTAYIDSEYGVLRTVTIEAVVGEEICKGESIVVGDIASCA